jgi:preprotein translocase subunit SecD
MENYRTRIVLAIAGVLLCFAWIAPNVINMENRAWLSKKLNFGLDIQGGLHLVMGVDVEGVVKESSSRLAAVLKADMNRENILINDVKVTDSKIGELTLTFAASESTRAAAVNYFDERYASMLQVMSSNETTIVVKYFEAYMIEYQRRVIAQAIETIRNRIDEFGVAEPSINQQGSDRILIQLPGMADAERAKALINTAAKLDFMIVEESFSQAELARLVAEAEKAGNYNLGAMKYSEYIAKVNEDLKGKIPEKTIVLFEKAESAASLESGAIAYLLRTDTDLTGDSLDDAFVSFDQYGNPEVSLRFNPVGAQKFKDLTGRNIGKRMAVVLDRVIKTAPILRSEIPNGQAVITLGRTRDRNASLEEAKMIATTLRAGALPAALEQLEERRVGPSLGSDSIQRAEMGALVGSILIFLFILVRYKAVGVISNVTLILNVLGVLGLLSALGATLTLPGIAGIALTIGMAVDANVLINERIREELAKGTSFALALKEGYARAMSAILDSNITTAATALVLLYFGTGPVRGFAVTLLIGIVTTLFANVFVSKVMLDTLVHKFGFKKLSV